MSTKILQYLSYYFYIIGKKESIINNSRRELIRQDNFYAPQLFNHLDKEKKEFLSLKDFKAFITFNYKEESLRKFIHVFDKDNNFAIDIYEFCNLVGADPNDNKEDVNVNETPSEKIISLCMNIIQAEIDLVDLCGDLVARIIKAPGFSTYEAFLTIDNKQKKFIDNENLSLFLKEYGYSDDDVDCIIWRLDTDQDRRLCIEEFRDMFTTFNYDVNAKSVTELKEILDEMFVDSESDNNYENNDNDNNAECNRVEDVDDIIINDDDNDEIDKENNSKMNTDNIENNNNKKRNSNIDVDEVVMNNEEDDNNNNNNNNQDNFNNNFNEGSTDNKNYNNYDNYNDNNQNNQTNNSYRKDNYKETFSPSSTHFRYGTGFNAETELQKIYMQRKNNESQSNKEIKEVNNQMHEGSNLTNNYSNNNNNNNNIKISSYNPNTKYQYDNSNTSNTNNNNDNLNKSFSSNFNRKDILNDTCRTLNLPYSTSPYKVNSTSIYNNNINNNNNTLNNNYNCNYGSNEGQNQVRTTYNYGISSNLRNNNESVPENYGNNYSNYGNHTNTIKDNNAFINSIRSAYSPYKSYSPIKATNFDSTIPSSNYNYKNYNTSTNYNPNKRLNSPQRINKNNDRFNLSPLNTMTNDFYSKYLSPTRRQQVYYSSMFNSTLNNDSRSNNFIRTNLSPFRSQYKSPIRELYTQTQTQIYRSPYKSPYRSPYKTNLSTSMNNISLNNNITYSPMSFSQRLPSPDRNQNPYSSTMPKRFALNQTKQSSSFCYVLDRILSIEMQNEKLKEINDIPGKYSLRELFRLFDTSDSGNISLLDFKKILYNEMELFPSLDEINMLFKKFDINRDGKLNYGEFCSIFLPSRNCYFNDSYLINNDFFSLQRFFIKLIDNEKSVELAKTPLNRNLNFNTFEMFEMIKLPGMSYFTSSELKNFMESHGYSLSYLEVEILFKRFDKSLIGKVNYRDFLQEVISK